MRGILWLNSYVIVIIFYFPKISTAKWRKGTEKPPKLIYSSKIFLIQTNFFFFNWAEFSLLHVGFFWLWWAGATLRCRAQALGTQASVMQHLGLVVVVHGLSCSKACGIFQDEAYNSYPLHWQAYSYPLNHQGSPDVDQFKVCWTCYNTASVLYFGFLARRHVGS